jgi:hypothetical protein
MIIIYSIALIVIGISVFFISIYKEKKNRKSNTMKSLVKFGSLGIILIGIFLLVSPFLMDFMIDKDAWTQVQKEELKKQIMNDYRSLNGLNADTANLVANCFVDEITKRFTSQDFWKQDTMTSRKILNGCLGKYGLQNKE